LRVKNSWVITLSLLGVTLACNFFEPEDEGINRKLPELVDAAENPEQAQYGKTKLSDYGFFKGNLKELNPTKNVFLYEVNAPLFTDYALKKRFIYLPDSTEMKYSAQEAFGFPNGAILIKNFYYSAEQTGTANRIIETRLLLKKNEEWSALPYIWNNDQTEAYLDVTGGSRTITLKEHGSFEYVIPNFKQCKNCHDLNGKFSPIGTTARQLLKNGQIMNWFHEDKLSAYPMILTSSLEDYTDTSKSLNLRARSYLDGNCGYCHRPGGSAKNSGLDLRIFSPNEFSLGVLKGPVAAGKGSGGLQYDIVPGSPEESILHYRMNSIDPAVMMPELGRSLIHKEGVALIAEWIRNMQSES
jgi:uncharacterized repeat protein (TIGR03806 family)